MYSPKFTYTDKLVGNLIKLEHNKTIIQNQVVEIAYDLKSKLGLRTKAAALFHVSHMVNASLTLKDSERIISGSLPTIEDPEKRDVLTNFRNLLEFNRSDEANGYPEFDKNIIIELNKLLITGWKETWDAKYRNFNEKVDSRWDSFVSLRDTEINAKDLDLEMNELVEWYKNVTPTMTPIVRIAIVIFRLIEISPFIAANKLTALSIADYLLVKNQYSSKYYSTIIKNVDQYDEEYIKAYSLSRKNHELTIWIEAFTELMNKELMEVRENLSEFVSEEANSKKQPFLDLNKRQLKVLKYLQTVPVIKREDYCHLMDVSTMTAFRDLNDLVRKRLLRVEGQGRGTKYKIAST